MPEDSWYWYLLKLLIIIYYSFSSFEGQLDCFLTGVFEGEAVASDLFPVDGHTFDVGRTYRLAGLLVGRLSHQIPVHTVRVVDRGRVTYVVTGGD